MHKPLLRDCPAASPCPSWESSPELVSFCCFLLLFVSSPHSHVDVQIGVCTMTRQIHKCTSLFLIRDGKKESEILIIICLKLHCWKSSFKPSFREKWKPFSTSLLLTFPRNPWASAPSAWTLKFINFGLIFDLNSPRSYIPHPCRQAKMKTPT